MNAAQAREITRRNQQGPAVQQWLDFVHKKIAVAAETGNSSIIDPLGGAPAWPTHEQQKALWAALRSEGYDVTHHPDLDPGHPCSRASATVSWA